MSKISLQKCMVWASGQYLTTPLPWDFPDLSDEEFDLFIEDHLSEEYEEMEPTHVFEMISDTAVSVSRFIEREKES